MKNTNVSSKETLKLLFKNYRRMDRRLCSQLKKMGIEVEKGKKHWILHVNGNCFTCSSTASDHRAGINLAQSMARCL